MSQRPQLDPTGADAPQPLDWKGTARYEVLRRIGRGAMGSVYEAFDRERRQRVALKTLLHSSPNAQFLLKQEFRALVDVRHPNLVRLYELVAAKGERMFFSMELVIGVDFLCYVDEPPPGVAQGATSKLDRLRSALRQLVMGLQALHTAGKLHRDVKPSNVLVGADGRVVILDFGVAADVVHGSGGSLVGHDEVAGTPRYMAPEEGRGPPTPASDWYSVGVMLYEALVGRPPFEGGWTEVSRMKREVDPPAPSSRAAGVPDDLDALCVALLGRQAARRPAGSEILRRLGTVRDAAPDLVTPTAPVADDSGAGTPLIGRGEQLLAMREAFESSCTGRSVTVRLSGGAGMGKSSLVRAFLDELAEAGTTLVLRGRAYERESMPYKAVDAVIDALSRHLIQLTDGQHELRLPEHMDALARLFPVLRRVPSVGERAHDAMTDPQRLRQRGFGALRELLTDLATRQPLVMVIDDVQWGDKDSVELLLELVRPPHAPPMLLVLAGRAEDEKTAPFSLELDRGWPTAAESLRVEVGPLDRGDAKRLALTLLGSSDERARMTAEAVAQESGGSPFLIEELLRNSTGELLAASKVTLESVVGGRLADLPERARRVVEMVSVGGRPLPVPTIEQAAQMESIDDVVALLTARRFVRSGMRDGREIVEPVHDRIREVIVTQLLPEGLRRYHADLARALEAAPDANPEALAMHWLAAGDGERAAHYAQRAGEQAAVTLAFEQAAGFYRMALEQAPASSTPDEVRRLRGRLAEMLQFAGRYEESARVYLTAADGAPAVEHIEFRRAAAEQLLMAGRIDEGADVLRAVLDAIGIAAPRSPLWAVFWLLVYRVWLAFVGLKFKEREADTVQRMDRVRVDALLTVSMGISMVDVILGACMQTRFLIEALRKGERLQVLRAAGLTASQLAATGKRETPLERDLMAIAKNMADRSKAPDAVAFYCGAQGVSLWNRGRWREAQGMLESAMSVLQPGFSGFSIIRLFDTYVHYFLGAFRECESRMKRLLVEAADRRDLFTSVNLRTAAGAWLALVADEPDRARREASQALSGWSQKSFSLQHWHDMVWGAEIELYSGYGESAYERMKHRQGRLTRSFLPFSGFVRAATLFMRGRAAIASIQTRPDVRRARIAEARRAARRLAREYAPWTAALSALLRAMAENAAGNRSAAIAFLREGIDRAEATGTIVYAVPARYRLGQLLGGGDGLALTREAANALAREGVRAPERWVNCHMPGDYK